MNYLLLIVKTSLKQFWDIDPFLVDNMLLNAKLQTASCAQLLGNCISMAGKVARNTFAGVSAEVQSVMTSLSA